MEEQQKQPSSSGMDNLEESLHQTSALMAGREQMSKRPTENGSQRRGRTRETRACNYCHKVGHLVRNCYQWQRDQVNQTQTGNGYSHKA
mgnify:CR=1 FL=1